MPPSDTTARWIPQQCPGPSPELVEAGLGWGDLGFTPKQAAALVHGGYTVVAVLPVRVQDVIAVAVCR